MIQKLPIAVIVDLKKNYQQKLELREGSLTGIPFNEHQWWGEEGRLLRAGGAQGAEASPSAPANGLSFAHQTNTEGHNWMSQWFRRDY